MNTNNKEEFSQDTIKLLNTNINSHKNNDDNFNQIKNISDKSYEISHHNEIKNKEYKKLKELLIEQVFLSKYTAKNY